MGENQSKPIPEEELSAEEIRRRRLAKLIHEQAQEEAEERKAAPKESNITSENPQDVNKELSVESQSSTKEEPQATNDTITQVDKELSPEDIRKLRLARIEREQAEREAEEKKIEESLPKPQNIDRSQSQEKEILPQVSSQAQEIKSESAEANIISGAGSQTGNVLAEENLNHPVYKEHGKEAYMVHRYFEDVYQGTCEPFSLEKRPELTFYKDLEEKQFTIENFDDVLQSLLEAADYYSAEQKVTLLIDVFQRLGNTELTGSVSDAMRNEFRKSILAYLQSYLDTPVIFCDQIAAENSEDIFDIKSPLCDALYDHLKSDDRQRIIIDLLANLEETSFPAIIAPLFKRITKKCRECRLDNTKELTSALTLLKSLIFADKRIIEFFVNHPVYSLGNMQNKTAIQFQRLTVFGSCLSLVTIPTESPAVKAFWIDKKIELGKREVVFQDLREKIHGTIDCVHRIMEHMIKVDQKYKNSVVDWLYEVLELNDFNQMTHNMGTIVSTIGWFTNYLVLLLRFCQKPLEDMSTYPSWFTKIDVNYIAARNIFKEVSLLNGRKNYYLQKPEKEFTFLTELVYMATHALKVHKSANEQFMTVLKKMGQIGNNRKTQLGYNVQLQDPYLHDQTLKLLTFDALLIIYTFDVPIKNMKDLDKSFESTQFIKGRDFHTRAAIPVYWAENIEEYLLFYWNMNSSLLTKNQPHFEILANFMLSVLLNPHWITNPHLKGKYIEFLSTLLPRKNDHPLITKRNADFFWIFDQNPFYEKYLISGLVHVFVEAEKSGNYEKYKYRESAAITINHLLRTVFPSGKASYVADCLNRMAKENYDVYLRFIMLYLNDIIHFLDEVFKNLRDIKSYEDDFVRDGLASLPLQERDERQMYYQANLLGCRTFSMYLKTFYQMGAAVTKVSPDFFMRDEIKDKFIVNLNYILDGLNGENATSLKVKNMNELEFDPKFLLHTVVQIYLNFSDKEEFIKGVSHDERSFKIELFYKTAQNMKNYNIMNLKDIGRFQALIKKLEVRAQEKKQEDDFMAKIKDIPDEFLDPITAEVMKDPVRLPSSQVIVDRLTIIKHLLSDDTDPFNRSKLTKEMLEPQPDLKQRIEEFFFEKKKNPVPVPQSESE